MWYTYMGSKQYSAEVLGESRVDACMVKFGASDKFAWCCEMKLVKRVDDGSCRCASLQMYLMWCASISTVSI